MRKDPRMPECDRSDPESVRAYKRAYYWLHHDRMLAIERRKYEKKRRVYSYTCVICGKTFTTTRKRSKACSDECRHELLKRAWKKYRLRKSVLKKRVCPVCGSTFEVSGSHKLYCSDECRNAVKRKRKALYAARNHDRFAEYRRRWKRTEKGRLCERRYRLSHLKEMSEKSKKYYYRHHAEKCEAAKLAAKKRREKGKSDLMHNIVSTESLYYARSLERAAAYAALHPEKCAASKKKYKLKRGLSDANIKNAAIWLSLGVYK